MKAKALLVMAMVSAASVSSAQVEPALIAKGEKVYMDKRCGACHAIKGKGGKAGPDLGDIGAKPEVERLKNFMKDPKAVNPQSKMLPFKGTEEELEALVRYLSSLK